MSQFYSDDDQSTNFTNIYAFVDNDSSIKFINDYLASMNFDGVIPNQIASVTVSNTTRGQFIGLYDDDGNINFYPIVRIDREDPILTPSYTGKADLYYIDSNNFLLSASYLDTDTIVIKKEVWADRYNGENGWIITKEGNAIFSNVAIRGELEATTLDVGGTDGIIYDGTTVTIGSSVVINAPVTVNALQVGASPTLLKIANDVSASNDGIYINEYNYWYSDGQFGVGGSAGSAKWTGSALSITGNINATSGSFSGALTASVGKIGGFTLNRDALLATNIILSSSGGLRLGSTANPQIIMTQAGAFTASTASIGGDSSINGTNIGNGGGNISSNLRVGALALYSNTTGSFNLALGDYALVNNINGSYNTALGYGSASSNKIGVANISIGPNTLLFSTNALNSIAIGNNAGRGSASSSTPMVDLIAIGTATYYNVTNADFGIAIGSSAQFSNTTGDNNIAIGRQALLNSVTGVSNVAIGNNAMKNPAGAPSFNVAVGDAVMSNSNSTGISNVAIGRSVLYNNQGDYNVGLGNYALFYNTTGTENVALGRDSMYLNESGVSNVAVGKSSLYNNSGGDRNVAVGNFALYTSTSGNDNVSIGASAMGFANTATRNVAIGTSSLWQTTGNDNVSVGVSSLFNSTSGFRNVAIGISSLYNSSTGDDNISIGSSALYSSRAVSVYSRNIAIGTYALQRHFNGNNNIAIGVASIFSSSSGFQNIAIGSSAAYSLNTGTENIIIGTSTGVSLTSGDYNVIIGDSAGNAMTGGNNNVAIGSNAMKLMPGSNNTIIGRGAFANQTTSGSANTAIGYLAGNNRTTTGNWNLYLGYIGTNVSTSSNVYIGSGNTLGININSSNNTTVYGGLTVDTVGLTVNAGGANITGNSTVTGTLDSTGTFVVGTRSSDVTTETEGQYLSAGNARSGIRRNTTTAGAGGDVLSIHKFNGAGTLTGTQRIVQFISDTSNAGHINIDSNLANAPAFAAPSDYRLKDDIQDFSYSTELIKNVKLRSFKWKNTGQYDVGFVAHELSEVSRDLVEGEKDGLNEEGLPEYQSVMYGRMVPYLAGAVKENILDIEKLYAKIEQLEERIKELENKNNV